MHYGILSCFRQEFCGFLKDIAKNKGLNLLGVDTVSAVKFKAKFKDARGKMVIIVYNVATGVVTLSSSKVKETFYTLNECYNSKYFEGDNSNNSVLSLDTQRVINFIELTKFLVPFRYTYLGIFKRKPYFGLPSFGVFERFSVDKENKSFIFLDDKRVSLEELTNEYAAM